MPNSSGMATVIFRISCSSLHPTQGEPLDHSLHATLLCMLPHAAASHGLMTGPSSSACSWTLTAGAWASPAGMHMPTGLHLHQQRHMQQGPAPPAQLHAVQHDLAAAAQHAVLHARGQALHAAAEAAQVQAARGVDAVGGRYRERCAQAQAALLRQRLLQDPLGDAHLAAAAAGRDSSDIRQGS